MKYNIRIIKPDGMFHAYMGHNGRTAWSKRQCQRHIKSAKTFDHFKGCTYVLEPDKGIYTESRQQAEEATT